MSDFLEDLKFKGRFCLSYPERTLRALICNEAKNHKDKGKRFSELWSHLTISKPYEQLQSIKLPELSLTNPHFLPELREQLQIDCHDWSGTETNGLNQFFLAMIAFERLQNVDSHCFINPPSLLMHSSCELPPEILDNLNHAEAQEWLLTDKYTSLVSLNKAFPGGVDYNSTDNVALNEEVHLLKEKEKQFLVNLHNVVQILLATGVIPAQLSAKLLYNAALLLLDGKIYSSPVKSVSFACRRGFLIRTILMNRPGYKVINKDINAMTSFRKHLRYETDAKAASTKTTKAVSTMAREKTAKKSKKLLVDYAAPPTTAPENGDSAKLFYTGWVHSDSSNSSASGGILSLQTNGVYDHAPNAVGSYNDISEFSDSSLHFFQPNSNQPLLVPEESDDGNGFMVVDASTARQPSVPCDGISAISLRPIPLLDAAPSFYNATAWSSGDESHDQCAQSAWSCNDVYHFVESAGDVRDSNESDFADEENGYNLCDFSLSFRHTEHNDTAINTHSEHRGDKRRADEEIASAVSAEECFSPKHRRVGDLSTQAGSASTNFVVCDTSSPPPAVPAVAASETTGDERFDSVARAVVPPPEDATIHFDHELDRCSSCLLEFDDDYQW